MKMELTISTDAIDEAALAKRREMGDGMGAVICFLGVVRGARAMHQSRRSIMKPTSKWPATNSA